MVRKNRYKERLRIFRCILAGLMVTRDEDCPIYIAMDKRYNRIQYIELDKTNLEILSGQNFIFYESTLKKLFLHMLREDYQDIPTANLVILANRKIRRLSHESCSKLLKITKEEYKKIEEGIITDIDLTKTSFRLNFSKSEFYYNFHDVLKEFKLGG